MTCIQQNYIFRKFIQGILLADFHLQLSPVYAFRRQRNYFHSVPVQSLPDLIAQGILIELAGAAESTESSVLSSSHNVRNSRSL